MIFAEVPTAFARVFAVAFGLVWGSFLNVVIHRVPRGMSVAHPPSHCPACGVPIPAYRNVPVLTWVLQRGRAACCGVRVSPRYVLVELLGGALALGLYEHVLRSSGGEPMLRASMIYLSEFALVFGLVAAAFIDLEHMIIPDAISLGGAILGVATASLRGMRLTESLVGAICGFVAVWLPFVVLYARMRGKAGMGLGDAKLTMLAGAWFGWPGALFVLFAGAIQGTLAALVVYVVRGKIDEPEAVRADRKALEEAAAQGDEEARELLADDPVGTEPEEGLLRARMPFGPFLIAACLEFLFFGKLLMRLALPGI